MSGSSFPDSEILYQPGEGPRIRWIPPDAGPRELLLDQEDSAILIGGGSDCDIQVPREYRQISRLHAEVRHTWAGVFLLDSSRNGVYVRGAGQRTWERVVVSRQLRHEDEIGVRPEGQPMRIVFLDEPRPKPVAERAEVVNCEPLPASPVQTARDSSERPLSTKTESPPRTSAAEPPVPAARETPTHLSPGSETKLWYLVALTSVVVVLLIALLVWVFVRR